MRLGVLANEKGYNQKKLSKLTDISQTTISRIFNGLFPAKSEYLCALANAIGAEVIISDGVYDSY
ncbi:MAG: helix-turn-helix transcriptional regulator [Saprospiraceae bacterium]|nr:helix-turn-helix transcriptional regulator [Saprospiraceae bacterium]